MEKNISYLNNKLWYRFLKVMYLGLFLIIIIISTLVIINSAQSKKIVDNDKSYIKCDNGEIKYLSKNNITLSSSYYIPDQIDRKLKELCANTTNNQKNIYTKIFRIEKK